MWTETQAHNSCKPLQNKFKTLVAHWCVNCRAQIWNNMVDFDKYLITGYDSLAIMPDRQCQILSAIVSIMPL
jgi:hypothetical protein